MRKIHNILSAINLACRYREIANECPDYVEHPVEWLTERTGFGSSMTCHLCLDTMFTTKEGGVNCSSCIWSIVADKEKNEEYDLCCTVILNEHYDKVFQGPMCKSDLKKWILERAKHLENALRMLGYIQCDHCERMTHKDRISDVDLADPPVMVCDDCLKIFNDNLTKGDEDVLSDN